METHISFILNHKLIQAKIDQAAVLLDYLRKTQRLTGTKEVCKEGDCGACTVLLGQLENGILKYKTINSCLFPIQKVAGKHIVTIEGINSVELNLIQKAFLTEGASQCGFCTPGFIISLTGYLLNATSFNFEDAINSIAGNICRCTGYHSIQRAVKNIGKNFQNINFQNLIEFGIIPKYFETIPSRLSELSHNSNEEISGNEIIISGGTDLFVQQADNLLNKELAFIEDIVKPRIWISDNSINISGSTTINQVSDFLQKENISLNFKKLFKLFASEPIRNSGTVAGNIVNASPIADITVSLLALGAIIVLRDLNGKSRHIELKKFFKGYKTLEMRNDEIIELIYLRTPDVSSFFNFEKVSKRMHLDIASVNSAICLEIVDDKIINASVSAGGVAPIPLYLRETSAFLKDKSINNQLVIETAAIAQSEVNPISDIRGSKEYKNLLLKQLIKAHFIQLFPNKVTEEVIQ